MRGALGRLGAPLGRHLVLSITALSGVLHLVWFFTFANSGGDLAAQDAWAEFVGRHPDSAYNLAWYGGMHPVSYSVVSPYLMSVLGVRTTMMIAGTLSAGLLALILLRCQAGAATRCGRALAGMFALLCNAALGPGDVRPRHDVRAGRGRRRLLLAAPLALQTLGEGRCARRRSPRSPPRASPVAGLFVGVVAVALFLTEAAPGRVRARASRRSVVVALSAWLFPFSGDAADVLGVGRSCRSSSALVVFLFAERLADGPDRRRPCTPIGVVLTWLITSQIGSNITRLRDALRRGGAARRAAVRRAALAASGTRSCMSALRRS